MNINLRKITIVWNIVFEQPNKKLTSHDTINMEGYMLFLKPNNHKKLKI